MRLLLLFLDVCVYLWTGEANLEAGRLLGSLVREIGRDRR
jgi:hypothetical protein